MKLSSILFFACLIQVIFSLGEDAPVIRVKGKPIHQVDPITMRIYIDIPVNTSNILVNDYVRIVLKDPSYIRADCTIFATPDTEGRNEFIKCEINANLFPFIRQTTLTLPDKLDIAGYSIENWELAKTPLDLANKVYPSKAFVILKD